MVLHAGIHHAFAGDLNPQYGGNKVNTLRHLFRHGAVFGTAALALACAERATTTAPQLTTLESASMASVSGSGKGAIVKRTVSLDEDEIVTATITKAGGTVYMPKAGLYIVFSKGAVREDLVITATAFAGHRLIYDFQPHGTVFEAPVYFAQELRYTELNTPRSSKTRPPVWGGYLLNGLSDVSVDDIGSFSETFAGDYYGKGNDALGYFATTHFSGYAWASGRCSTDGF